MNRTDKIWLLYALAVVFTVTAQASAQDINFAKVTPGSSRIHLATGLDSAAMTTLGYTGGFSLASKTALWSVDLGIGIAEIDTKDMRARAGLQAVLWQSGSWRAAARGRLIARHTSNSIYDGAGFGADLTAHFGFYRSGWFLAGLIGYDRTIVMHLTHSNWYRDTIFDEAVDGWYQGKSGILHGGLAAGKTIGAVEVSTRLEMRRLDRGEALMPPAVAELSVTIPF